MKRSIFLSLVLCVSVFVFGQGEIDALRMSDSDLQGTARGQAMGGAFGALGGDITGVIINPAGLGIYRSSELSATLGVSYDKATSNWMGMKTDDSKTRFNFNNISYVGYFPTGNSYGIRSVNFGFTYHRLKNFNSRYHSRGTGMETSLTDYISEGTNGIHWSQMELSSRPYNNADIPWLSSLAWQGELIADDNAAGTHYQPYFLENGETVSPNLINEEKGGIHAYDFSFGMDIDHTLYLGATFSLTDIDYRMNSFYEEDYAYGDGFYLENWMETQGSGYQLKVGAIWRPINELRVGVSYHSPTWYSMTDYYQGWAQADWADRRAETPSTAHTNYKLQSPYSWTFSLAGVIGQNLILSADYEIKDYTAMNLKDADGFNYYDQNSYIDEDYRMASTIRVGAEYKITPQLAVRLGYANQQSPYEAALREGNSGPALVGTIPHYTIEKSTSYYTGGVGYRFTPQFYVDLAFVHKQQERDLYYFPALYDMDGNRILESKSATLKNAVEQGLLTFGYKF